MVVNKIMKYTIFDPNYVEKVVEITTESIEAKKAVIKGKDSGVIELKPHMMSKKLQQFLADEGYEIETFVTTKRRGMKSLCGIKVNVLPRNHSNYNGGIVMTFVCTGVDDEDLTNDIRVKTNKIMGYFTKHKIPLDRVCEESLTGCEYKFY